jgi:predicted nuclease of predicted toxin-antitoxin system
MRILVDENIPSMTVVALKEKGHDVLDLRGSTRQGLADSEVWAVAQGEHRLLITTDKGFASRRHERHSGVIVVHLRQPNRLRIHQRVMTALNLFSSSEWAGTTLTMRDRVQSVTRFQSG